MKFVNVIPVIVLTGGFMNFGEWCRAEVNKSGRTITWLAHQVGAHPSLIVKWRTRNSNPKTEYFLLICITLAKDQNRSLCTVIEEGALAMGVKINLDS